MLSNLKAKKATDYFKMWSLLLYKSNYMIMNFSFVKHEI